MLQNQFPSHFADIRMVNAQRKTSNCRRSHELVFSCPSSHEVLGSFLWISTQCTYRSQNYNLQSCFQEACNGNLKLALKKSQSLFRENFLNTVSKDSMSDWITDSVSALQSKSSEINSFLDSSWLISIKLSQRCILIGYGRAIQNQNASSVLSY